MGTTDEAKARAKAHETCGANLSCWKTEGIRPGDHSNACDRLTALLVSHARELAEANGRAEREAAQRGECLLAIDRHRAFLEALRSQYGGTNVQALVDAFVADLAASQPSPSTPVPLGTGGGGK